MRGNVKKIIMEVQFHCTISMESYIRYYFNDGAVCPGCSYKGGFLAERWWLHHGRGGCERMGKERRKRVARIGKGKGNEGRMSRERGRGKRWHARGMERGRRVKCQTQGKREKGWWHRGRGKGKKEGLHGGVRGYFLKLVGTNNKKGRGQ